MKSILAFALIALCSAATATDPRFFPRNSRGNCPQQSRDFRRDPHDFRRDLPPPQEIITETEIRRGPFGRVRSQSTTRTVR